MGFFQFFLIFSFQTYFYFSILPWGRQIKHHNFSGMMLIIFFFLPAPFPGRRSRRDKRETKTHRHNLHKPFLNHCMGHDSTTRKLTPMSVWATGSGTPGLFVCPLLLDDILPKGSYLPESLPGTAKWISLYRWRKKDIICSARPFRGMCCPSIALLTHSRYIYFTSFPTSLHMGEK